MAFLSSTFFLFSQSPEKKDTPASLKQLQDSGLKLKLVYEEKVDSYHIKAKTMDSSIVIIGDSLKKKRKRKIFFIYKN